MRLTRIHVDAPLSAGSTVALPDAAAGHLLRVLRLGVGDACLLFNGDGRDYHARIATAGKRAAAVEILEARDVDNESPLRIVLLQAIARGEKMDWIVQKATELGVAGIVPVHGERGEVKLDAERADKRLAHWRSVAVSACEQSGRARVPEIALPLPLAKAVETLAPPHRYTLDPDADRSLSSLAFDPASASQAAPPRGRGSDGRRGSGTPVATSVAPAGDAPGAQAAIAIGPEGGWSPGDLALLRGAGFTGLRLGPRVLRTETAGLAAIAALQARFGDFA